MLGVIGKDFEAPILFFMILVLLKFSSLKLAMTCHFLISSGRSIQNLVTGEDIEDKMGCFKVLKSKKKKAERTAYIKRINPQELTPTTLPEPKLQSRTLQSAPPSFRTLVKPVQPVKRIINSRTRALSAPSSLNTTEQDALASNECEEQEELKSRVGLTKEQRSPSPQPLPLPSPQGTVVLKATGSFKAGNASGPLYASGPLPLPPLGALRNFGYEELSNACLNFSSDRCVSEGLSSIIYKASFGDDASGSKKLEATVTRLHPSTQVSRLSGFLFECRPWIDYYVMSLFLNFLQFSNCCKLYMSMLT